MSAAQQFLLILDRSPWLRFGTGPLAIRLRRPAPDVGGYGPAPGRPRAGLAVVTPTRRRPTHAPAGPLAATGEGRSPHGS